MSAGTRSHAKGMQHVINLNTAQPLLVPEGAIFALIQPRGQAVWFTNDGSTPSATNGIRLAVDQILEYDGELEKFRALEASASATLEVAYFGL